MDPNLLREHAGQLYLLAFDLQRNAPRWFKLARVSVAELTTQRAERAGDCDSESDASVGIWSGPRLDIELWIAPEAVQLVREHPLPHQVLAVQSDGSALVSATVAGDVEITAWVLAWGPNVRVLAPVALRAKVCGLLLAAVAGYAAATHPGPGHADANP